MTAPAITDHNVPMDPAHPRADGPRPRRTFTTADKIAHLTAYEHACEHGGGAYLRREGLHSSLISEWRKQRDAGVPQVKKPYEKVSKLTSEQAEIARLTRELARANKRLTTTEAAWASRESTRSLGKSLRGSRFGRDEQQTMTCLIRTHRCRHPGGEHADRSRPLDLHQTQHRSTIAHTAGGGPPSTGQQTQRPRTSPRPRRAQLRAIHRPGTNGDIRSTPRRADVPVFGIHDVSSPA